MKRAVGLVVFAALLLSACGRTGGGQSPSPGTPKQGGTLRVAQESELNTLDPLKSALRVERSIFYNMYESLVGIDQGLNIQPLLATRWETPDPKTYVFTLRSGVKFHDGTEFNAAAVKFNIDRILTAPASPRKSELASVQSVEVRDPSTVVVHLKNPDASLLSQLVDRAGMILSPTAIQKAGADLGRNPLGAGTGPFQFVEWKRDDHLTLKKNTSYWKSGIPYLDEVIFRPITNDDARTAALRTGDIDVARTIAFKDVPSVKSDSNFIYKSVPGLGFEGVWLNRGAAPFSDPAKAKAVAMAIDRAAIVKNVFFNVGSVAHGPIPPTSWAFDPSEKIYDLADPDRAKATATGFSFTLKTRNRPDHIQWATLIKDQLAKAGITTNLQTEEFGQLQEETAAHNFQASLLGWSGRIDPDGNMFSQYHTGAGLNYGQYSNPPVDKLLENGRIESDQAKRKQLYQDAQKTIVSDVPYVFIYHGVAEQITSRKVHDFQLISDEIFRFAPVWKD